MRSPRSSTKRRGRSSGCERRGGLNPGGGRVAAVGGPPSAMVGRSAVVDFRSVGKSWPRQSFARSLLPTDIVGDGHGGGGTWLDAEGWPRADGPARGGRLDGEPARRADTPRRRRPAAGGLDPAAPERRPSPEREHAGSFPILPSECPDARQGADRHHQPARRAARTRSSAGSRVARSTGSTSISAIRASSPASPARSCRSSRSAAYSGRTMRMTRCGAISACRSRPTGARRPRMRRRDSPSGKRLEEQAIRRRAGSPAHSRAGSRSIGLTGRRPSRISKWSCGSLAAPVAPARAIVWPRFTACPRATSSLSAWP